MTTGVKRDEKRGLGRWGDRHDWADWDDLDD